MLISVIDYIWVSYGQKATQKHPKIAFYAAGKYFNIHNLGTTNTILMKLTTIMDLHDTFYLAKNWGFTHRMSVGAVEKLPKNDMKFTNFRL